MNRWIHMAVLGAFLGVSSGCASVTVEAPAGNPVALATTGKPTTQVKTFRKWYFFWGMVPVSDVSTAQNIRETGFKVVRVVTKMGIDDFLLSITVGLLGIVPVSRTVEIWGE